MLVGDYRAVYAGAGAVVKVIEMFGSRRGYRGPRRRGQGTAAVSWTQCGLGMPPLGFPRASARSELLHRRAEPDRRPDARLHVGLRHPSRNLMGGLPPRAMTRHNHVGLRFLELLHGPWDDWLEETAGQVEASDHGVQTVHA